jgi:hypothetical protein
MRRQVSFYLDRAARRRAPALGAATEVKPVIEGLVRTFEKVYRERALTFSRRRARRPALSRRGAGSDRSDRQPARQCGQMGARAHRHPRRARSLSPMRPARLYFTAWIDDDGPGLDPQERAAALVRGQRLDESRPGSGLGLSIVVDLAAIYGGSLRLEESPLGGLRARLRLPRY